MHRHYQHACSDDAVVADELPQECGEILAQGPRRSRPSRYAGRRLPASVTRGRLVAYHAFSQGRWTRFRLSAATRELLRHARSTDRPEGWMLTSTSKPCGHRFSGDQAGFRRSCEQRRCVTGISRADTASEIQYSPAKPYDISESTVAERDCNFNGTSRS